RRFSHTRFFKYSDKAKDFFSPIKWDYLHIESNAKEVTSEIFNSPIVQDPAVTKEPASKRNSGPRVHDNSIPTIIGNGNIVNIQGTMKVIQGSYNTTVDRIRSELEPPF